jgi:hypothetical protein
MMERTSDGFLEYKIIDIKEYVKPWEVVSINADVLLPILQELKERREADDKQTGKEVIKMEPLWATVAQGIGKQINESFIWERGIYKISDNGLCFWDEKKIEWKLSSRTLELLSGQGTIGTVGENCHKCGVNIKVLPANIKFCPYCGAKTI